MGGWALPSTATWCLVWCAFYLIPNTINVFSVLTEHERGHHPIAAWEPMTWEYSSSLGSFAALSFVYLAVGRSPGWGRAPWRTLAIHAAALVGYGAVHISLMMGLRFAVYAAAGLSYHMGDWHLEVPYEFRKDTLSFILATTILTGGRQLARLSRVVALVEAQQAVPVAEAPAPVAMPTAGDERLELKVGSRRLFLAPEEIIQVAAAGKYVEVMTANGVHLIRRPLKDVHADLPPGRFVRVHRSRLVNRAAIQRVDTRPSGDLDITLSTGTVVPASRRYKAELLEKGL